MVTGILFLSFVAFLALKVPVSAAMGASSIIALWLGNYPLPSLPQFMGYSVMSYTLMAIPFFIFAGAIQIGRAHV
jgi:hypothetical protein